MLLYVHKNRRLVRDKVTRQCPQTTTFEEKGDDNDDDDDDD